MKQWILCVRTSLPDVCYSKEDLKLNLKVFNSFDEAKQEFRNTIKKYAFEENAMFDGKGHLINFENFACDCTSKEEEEMTDDYLYKEDCNALSDLLVKVFEGQDVSLEDILDYKTNWLVDIKKTEDIVSVFGNEEYDELDGPENGYDPHIRINCFNMLEEKEYFLHIVDMFDVEVPSELYIDLKQSDN